MSILLTEDDLTAKELATLNEWPEERRERLRGEVVEFVRKRITGTFRPDPIEVTDEGPAPCGLPMLGPSRVVPPLPGGSFVPDPVFLREEVK